MKITNLPNEVLSNIFLYYLPQAQLVQCQLVNKQWNKASVKALYSNVTIRSSSQCKKYIRTIENSPKLAFYLITIDAGQQFDQIGHFGNETILLKTVWKCCPNITHIAAEIINPAFWACWTPVHYCEIGRKQMRRMELIPEPVPDCDGSNDGYRLYCCPTTLLIKRLKEWTFIDYHCNYQHWNMPLYKSLDLKKFSNLEHLIIHSTIMEKRLTNFDTIIQDAGQLNTLTILIDGPEFDNLSRGTSIFFDRPSIENPIISNITTCDNIHRLESDWELIDTDKQMTYIMQKFQKLDYFKTQYRCKKYHRNYANADLSATVLNQFLDYVSKISEFHFKVLFFSETESKEVLIHIWKIMESNPNFLTIFCWENSVPRNMAEITFNNNNVLIKLHEKSTFLINYALDYFSSDVGRSLQIASPLGQRQYKREKIMNGYEVLWPCPFMKHLEITPDDPSNSKDIDEFIHSNLESLIVRVMRYSVSEFLKRSRFKLHYHASIHFIDHSLDYEQHTFTDVSIDIPHAKLILLSWDGSSNVMFKKPKKYFITLRTGPSYIQYFSVKNQKLYIENEIPKEIMPVNNSLSSHLVFNITCQYIYMLQLKFDNNSPPDEWCFNPFEIINFNNGV